MAERFRNAEFDVPTVPGGKADLRHLLRLYAGGYASIGFVLDALDKAVVARDLALLERVGGGDAGK